MNFFFAFVQHTITVVIDIGGIFHGYWKIAITENTKRTKILKELTESESII